MNEKHLPQEELLTSWLAIGKRNYCINRASDPEFTLQSLSKCETIEELKTNIGQGNWCTGQGFYYENLCFINQVNGGDEWLTIKEDLAFESFTFERIIKDGEFESRIENLLNASLIDCANLTYKE